MKVSPERREENHDEIVRSAAAAFRAKGVNGVGLQEIMAGAGLTPGAFYGHFKSKDVLVGAAFEFACDCAIEILEKAAKSSPDDPVGGMIAGYLSEYLRDTPEEGCAIAGMGDLRSCSPDIKRVFGQGFLDMTSVVATHLKDGSRAERRATSMVIVSAMIGAMIVVRNIDEKKLSDDVMATVSRTLSALVK